jgi:hypothetical protein
MFLNDWKQPALRGLQQAFGLTPTQLRGVDILLAAYGGDEFGGEAFVLFRRDGVLYEVNALQGSDGGLSDQWEPEETSVRALTHRLEKGLLGRTHRANPFVDELRFLLIQLARPL